MNTGSISELILKRSVIKHIRKNCKEVLKGSAVGNDYAILDNMVIADGKADGRIEKNSSDLLAAELAYIRAVNNISTSGADIKAIRVDMIFPEMAEEKAIKREMEKLNELCDADGIQILGGHTEVSSAVSEIMVSITIYGKASEKKADIKEKISCGDAVIITGYAGYAGAAFIVKNNYQELTKRFAPSYISGLICSEEMLCIKKAAEIAFKHGAKYIHDVSTGGIYGALGQVAENARLGIKVNHKQIPVCQEVIEICEFYDINPYMLMGTGSAVIVCDADKAENIVRELKQAGIVAGQAGFITKEKEKMIIAKAEDVKRHLTPACGDELYKILK